MTLLERLKELDKMSFENDTRFYDLQSLYEGTRLSAEHKQELKKIIDSTDDTEKASALAGAYIQTIENERNESLDCCDAEDDGCVICEECGGEKKLNPNTGNYYCPKCEQYLIESDFDRDDYISENFFYDDGTSTYFAKWNEDVINDKENYDIFALPDWADADDDSAWDYLFTVDSLTTVGEVIDEIKSNFNESLNCNSVNLGEELLTEGKNLDKTWEQVKGKVMDKFDRLRWFGDEENVPEKDYRGAWMNYIISWDPTYKEGTGTTGDYGTWLTKMFCQTDVRRSRHKIEDMLKEFKQKKPNLEKKDINQYKSYEELEDALKNTPLSKKQQDKQLKKSSNIKGADTLFTTSDGKWTVYSPHTYEASCALRNGDYPATWCTGATSDDYWYKHYTSKGKLYIIINNENPREKYQAYIPNDSKKVQEFRDAQNGAVKFRTFIEETVPELSNFFYDNEIVWRLNDGDKSDNPKVNALAAFLEVPPSEIIEESDTWFKLENGQEYLVLTDEEADLEYHDEIVNTLQSEWGLESEYDLLISNIDSSIIYDCFIDDCEDKAYNLLSSHSDGDFENALVELLYNEGYIDDDDFYKDESGNIDYSLCTASDASLVRSGYEHFKDWYYDKDEWFEQTYSTENERKDFLDAHWNDVDFERAANEFERHDYDGRGEWISGYDGREYELPLDEEDENAEQYYAYRMG